MNIIYVARARIPSEKAHPYQILKMCEAFAKKAKVELVVPFRVQTPKMRRVKNSVQEYYAIKEKFKIKKLPSIDFLWVNIYIAVPRVLQNCIFYLQAAFFAFLATLYSLLKKADVYYTRDRYSAFFFGYFNFLHKKIYYEAHAFEPLVIRLMKKGKIDGLIVTARVLKELYAEEIPERKIFVAPHGVDLAMFSNNNMSKEEARGKLNLPLPEKIVCYTGHLYNWKGVYSLAQSAKYLKAFVYFIGGTDEDIENFKKFVKENNITNIVIVGHVPPAIIPMYLSAADVVVLPTLGKDILKVGAMPLKLFEYMAARRPVVASDLPSVREILNEENAVLVAPGDPKALAEGIQKILDDRELGSKLAEKAFIDVKLYTWEKRAERVLEFISEK